MFNSIKLYENKNIEILVAAEDGYCLFKENRGKKGFLYSVYDPKDVLVYSWVSFNDVEKFKDIRKSPIYRIFLDEIDHDKKFGKPLLFNDDGELVDEDDLDDALDGTEDDYLFPRSPRKFSDFDDYPRFSYVDRVKEKGIAQNLCKSNTLVFHKNDPTTRMLCQIYEGKGWDVLTKSCSQIDDDEVKELFEKHDRLVFLGHGTSYGLIGMFGPEVAKYMKNKKIFAIWCNADKYFKQNGIGEGQFITKNAPSEVWECEAAGCGNISAELMLENITYWSKLCADVVEECLEGDPQKGVDYIRMNYLEKYGNHPVSIFNADSAHVLGSDKPLPKYTFKGKPLEEKDYPVPNFDEEEFLKNPTAEAVKCPRKVTDEE